MISIFFGGGGKFWHHVDNLSNFVTNVNMKKKNLQNLQFFWGKIHQTFEITNLEKKKKKKMIMIIIKN